MLEIVSYKQRWFSGRILACHAGGPGSIPGRCKLFEYPAQRISGRIIPFTDFFFNSQKSSKMSDTVTLQV